MKTKPKFDFLTDEQLAAEIKRLSKLQKDTSSTLAFASRELKHRKKLQKASVIDV